MTDAPRRLAVATAIALVAATAACAGRGGGAARAQGAQAVVIADVRAEAPRETVPQIPPATRLEPPRPCDRESACGGTVTEQLTRALTTRARRGQRCFEEALATAPRLQGHVELQVRVSSDGSSCVRVQRDELGNGVAACVSRLVTGSDLPPPENGCVDVVLPLTFIARGGSATNDAGRD